MNGERFKVAIVGHGLIGGSIALALERLPDAHEVVVLDIGDDLARTVDAGLIILAAPISANIRILAELPRVLTGEALITDTGSTKATTVAAACDLPPHLEFIGGHPMAGAATNGRSAARADLFDGKRWILTPRPGTRPDALARLRRFVETLGATTHVMDAAEHDRVVAFISHLPQLAISALMHVAGTAVAEPGLALAGPGLRDSTRIAASPGALWQEVIAANRVNVNAALDKLIATLQRLRQEPDDLFLAEVLASSAQWKASLDAS